MQLYCSLSEAQLQDTWLTIGSFDGVHTGHRSILRRLIAGAHTAGAPAAVLTFNPHPAVVLRGRSDPYALTTPDERAALLGELGIDAVIVQPFNHEVAALTARQFVQSLVENIGLRDLCVGHDFALGRGRAGAHTTTRTRTLRGWPAGPARAPTRPWRPLAPPPRGA